MEAPVEAPASIIWSNFLNLIQNNQAMWPMFSPVERQRRQRHGSERRRGRVSADGLQALSRARVGMLRQVTCAATILQK